MTPVLIQIPGLVVVSEANRRDHWSVRRRRFIGQKTDVLLSLRHSLHHPYPALPLVITFTRCGGRRLDSDNLAGAFKACRDEVARVLRFDDGDPMCEWVYSQRPGKWKGIEILIEKPRFHEEKPRYFPSEDL